MSLLDDALKRLAAAKAGHAHTNGHTNGHVDPGTLYLRPLSEFEARPVRYLVPRTIPVGKVTMFAGVGGMGKSTIMRHLIACLTAGRPAFGLDYDPAPPCDVLLASVEDSPQDTILPHLSAERADLDRVLIESGVRKSDWKPGDRTAPFDLRDLDLVLAAVNNRPAIRLIVIDPIGSYVARSGANENSAGEVRALLDPLHDLAERTGAAVILIAHLNKANNVAAVNRIVGSAAFRDTCRVVYVLGSDPDEPTRRVLAVAKENIPGLDRRGLAFRRVDLTPEEAAAVFTTRQMVKLTDEERAAMATQLAKVATDGRVDIDADQALGTGKKPAGTDGRSRKREECRDWLLTFLARYAYPAADVFEAAEVAGFSQHQCYRAREAHNEGKPDAEQIWVTNRNVFGGPSWWGIGNYRGWRLRPAPGTEDPILVDLDREAGEIPP